MKLFLLALTLSLFACNATDDLDIEWLEQEARIEKVNTELHKYMKTGDKKYLLKAVEMTEKEKLSQK